jgi:hypothetical protein
MRTRKVAALRSVLVLGGTALLMSACSTATRQSTVNDDIDVALMTLINKRARDTGNKVIWVNPPRKKQAASKDSK